ncbi:hypothetical protein OG196_14570 [Kitasatospora purpeofusca]|uniref:hypothetical protein n=1 Tax=Kitasatospora purpeofusca TaxID=67352 RepID=UPI002E0E4D40|nr:hypothetical protein OG196_14570 [Kitasatospora purpeofusca]
MSQHLRGAPLPVCEPSNSRDMACFNVITRGSSILAPCGPQNEGNSVTAPSTPRRPSVPPAPGAPPRPAGPPAPTAAPARRNGIDLQGWSAVVTAAVAVVTLGTGFAGGFFTQARVASGDRPQPTVTVTVPGPTVTIAGPTVPAAPAVGTNPRPSINPLPSAVAGGSATPTAVRVLAAVPDSGRGGAKTVLTGENYPPDVIVRVSFVVKDPLGADHKVRDLRDTKTDARGSFSVEVVVPSDLTEFEANSMNSYLRAGVSPAMKGETVFDLLP